MASLNSLDTLFKYRHFAREIIILCVRWYVNYKLSYQDLVEMMAERGVRFAHTTVRRWVQRFIPVFEKRWMRFARPVGKSWRVDETYIRVRGQVRACSLLYASSSAEFGSEVDSAEVSCLQRDNRHAGSTPSWMRMK